MPSGYSDFAAQATAITVRPEKSRTFNIVGFKIFDYYKLTGLFSYILSQVRKRG